ncbi:MAG: corrinoid protein [Clostridia bacterium]|jgi:5-methyltetrahydrofolate--homocysteine methyltransferase|nr:corrinoid protein [Clostridia bacterium]NLT18877.1 cobalamin-binding protein [Clostridiales bacterium]OQC12854.1 MAG: Methionine synthase [Firmicutes bacterium ADurb.Bin080]
MEYLQTVNELIQKGKSKDIQLAVKEALDSGVSAADILNKAMIPAMEVIGSKFKSGEIFVPEVLISARAMNKGTEILRPALLKEGVKPIGKAIICTVKGDLHDVGKNLVKMMLEGVGIECIDLGVDVDGKKVVEAVKSSGAALVCLSALLTTTMANQKEIIDSLVAAGIRNKVKVMVGGAPLTSEFAEKIGADAFTADAASAAEVAKKFCLNQ